MLASLTAVVTISWAALAYRVGLSWWDSFAQSGLALATSGMGCGLLAAATAATATAVAIATASSVRIDSKLDPETANTEDHYCSSFMTSDKAAGASDAVDFTNAVLLSKAESRLANQASFDLDSTCIVKSWCCRSPRVL